MISCLCVTHERPEFMPWVEHQFLKQTGEDFRGYRKNGDSEFGSELIIIDSSVTPWISENPRVRVVHAPGASGIAEKRSRVLEYASGEFISWFDDDDWQDPFQLGRVLLLVNDNEFDAVGSRTALMYSTLTGKCSYYESRYEPIIFNSAVYRKNAVPTTFNEGLATGEDTDWQLRFFETKPNFITLGEPMHAWLCHTKNVTNKSSSKFFERACTIPFDDWEREFLAKLYT